MSFVVGLHAGAAVALTPLSPAVLPRLEGGVQLPFAGGRVRAVVAASWSRPTSRETAEDPRVPDGTWSYDLRQTVVTVGAGASVKLADAVVDPEIVVIPQLTWLQGKVDGEAGSAFGEAVETSSRFGVYAAPGVRKALGPGELVGRVAFTISDLSGAVTGDSSSAAVAPTVGYQLVF